MQQQEAANGTAANTADASMDIDMDLDLGPLPEPETIEAVSTIDANLTRLRPVFSNVQLDLLRNPR